MEKRFYGSPRHAQAQESELVRYNFDWICDKSGWKILIIEGRQQDVKIELLLTDQDAVKLYKLIGENFDVESSG